MVHPRCAPLPRLDAVSPRSQSLKAEDWRALCEQAQAQGEHLYQSMPGGSQFNLPQGLGRGGDRTVSLRGGLTLEIRCAELQQTLHIEQQHGATFPLVAKFYLAGMSHIQTLNASDIPADYSELAGYHYLYHLPNHTEIEEWPAGQPLHLVTIYANADYFAEFSTNYFPLPQPLQKLLEGDAAQRFHQSLGPMTATMRRLVQQIVHCPYQGLMQQLYLEGKALELLALQFAAWAEERPSGEALRLRSHDIQQLHQAREILIQQANHPPSLKELAHQVGLNDRKLKQGFRQLFGTTVFGYLQTYRMEQAQEMLKNADVTVAQVAQRVGYRNPEAFSTAFRRQFAVSPKAYQLGQRR